MKLLKYMTLYDKILIISIIVVSISAIIFPIIYHANIINNRINAEIMIQSGKTIVKKIKLENTYREKPIIFKIEGPVGISVIEAHKGRVRMKKAAEDCPLKICEKTGWISEAGPQIICVPNKVTVWIKTGENDIDGISR